MIRALPLLLALATPAVAQDMGGMPMPGMAMEMPAKKPAAARKRAHPARAPVAAITTCLPDHAAMGHCTPSTPAPAAPASMAAMPDMAMPAMPDMAMPAAPDPACPPEHAAMGHCTPAVPAPVTADASGTALPAGNTPPPAPPTDRAADRFYPAATMAQASAAMRQEHGGITLSQILFNIAEVQVRRGREGYRWDGEGWYGGDIHRLVVKTEGEGAYGDRLDDAEVQALYSRAIDPYFNLQAGVRHNVGTGPDRSYATVGVEGLAPYWFEVEAAAFLSDKGDVLGRIEAWYDQRLTQRLILQPRVEANLAAQDMPANGIGSGLSNIESGLRLRYEIAREFAPYVGVSWDRSLGDTARFARTSGDRASSVAFVAGIRTWF